MLLILGDQLILHSVMKDSLLMVKRPEFHYGSRYSGVAAKVLLRQYSGCKSLRLSYPEDTQWCCLFWKFDLNIFCCHFVKAHSVLSKCWTECSLFLKPVHPLGKKTHTIECNIFTSCVFLWWCFLKNNINHPLSSQEEKVHVIDSHLAFSGWKVVFQTSLWTKKNAILPLKLNISAGHSEWWVNQREGFPLTPTHPHTHTFKVPAYTCS